MYGGKVSLIYEIPKGTNTHFKSTPGSQQNHGQPPKGEINMSKPNLIIYVPFTRNSQLYSKALSELKPTTQHYTVTTQFNGTKIHNWTQHFNQLKHQAFNYNLPILFIAEQGLYKLDQYLIHTHLCKNIPVKVYTPTESILFTSPQQFTQYCKAQARAYYQRRQNKIYYQELLTLAQQFNISKAKLDQALIKHRDKLIAQGKTTNAYESYLVLLKQYLIQKYDEQHNIPESEPTESIDTLINTPVQPTTEPTTPTYENYSLIDETTLIQLQALKLTQLKAAAKQAHIKRYSKLNKAELINLLIPILYPEANYTTESLDLHYNL